jgi:hypothetical protein
VHVSVPILLPPTTLPLSSLRRNRKSARANCSLRHRPRPPIDVVNAVVLPGPLKTSSASRQSLLPSVVITPPPPSSSPRPNWRRRRNVNALSSTAHRRPGRQLTPISPTAMATDRRRPPSPLSCCHSSSPARSSRRCPVGTHCQSTRPPPLGWRRSADRQRCHPSWMTTSTTSMTTIVRPPPSSSSCHSSR